MQKKSTAVPNVLYKHIRNGTALMIRSEERYLNEVIGMDRYWLLTLRIHYRRESPEYVTVVCDGPPALFLRMLVQKENDKPSRSRSEYAILYSEEISKELYTQMKAESFYVRLDRTPGQS